MTKNYKHTEECLLKTFTSDHVPNSCIIENIINVSTK